MVPIKDHDKLMACGVNVAAIFFPYAGPIVGAILGAKSPYVKYHAYRNLIEQIVSTLIIGFLMICSLTYSIYSLYHQMEGGFDWHKIDWWALILKSLITWLLLTLWGVINTILSIRDALQALGGQLPEKPKWTERNALAMSGMDKVSLAQPVLNSVEV